MSNLFAFDPKIAADTLADMSVLPRQGASSVNGHALAQAQIATLQSADLLAAQAGVIPWIKLPDGSRGVLVGSARDVIDRAPENIRSIYLAAHETVRAIDLRVQPSGSTVSTIGAPTRIGFVPIVAYVAVVGIAAIVAGAWYAAEAKRATVQAENARLVQLAEVEVNARLATQQLAATGKIDPSILHNLDPSALAPPGSLASKLAEWAPVLLIAGAGVAGVAYAHRKGLL